MVVLGAGGAEVDHGSLAFDSPNVEHEMCFGSQTDVDIALRANVENVANLAA